MGKVALKVESSCPVAVKLDAGVRSARITSMIKVTYRDKQWEVSGHKTVRDVIQEVGLNPATVLAVRHGKLVLDSELLGEDDELKLIAVISGG